MNGCDLDGWDTRVPRQQAARSCAPGKGDILDRYALMTPLLAGVMVDGAGPNK